MLVSLLPHECKHNRSLTLFSLQVYSHLKKKRLFERDIINKQTISSNTTKIRNFELLLVTFY